MAENTQPPAPQQPPAPTGYVENPGQTLGIIGIVLNAVGINIGGIILGAMSRSKSKQANMSTTLGTVSLVWGIVGTVLAVLAVALWVIVVVMSATHTDPMRLNNSDYSSPVDSDATYSQ